MKKNDMKISLTICLLATFLFASSGFLFAQKASLADKSDEIKLTSEILNEERTATVYLPKNYETSTEKYPVIYLLDGKWNADHTVAATTFLSNQGSIPKTIVVAIHNVDRNRDFSPVHIEKIPTSGGADKFLDFMSDELATYMNKNYKTSGYDILVGHSFGGTFAAHALLTKPETFDAYVAISPYLHFADNYLIEKAKTDLKNNYEGQKQFYMVVGDEPKYYEALDAFSTLVNEKCGDAVSLTYKKMEDEDHKSIPYVAAFKGLKNTFSDYSLNKETFMAGLEAMDKHYAMVSEKYGTQIQTPEFAINKLGYMYLGDKEMDKAVQAFTENVKRYPKSANVYDSLGEALENNGEIEKAASNYKKACELGEANNDKNLAIYKKNCERVQNQLSMQK